MIQFALLPGRFTHPAGFKEPIMSRNVTYFLVIMVIVAAVGSILAILAVQGRGGDETTTTETTNTLSDPNRVGVVVSVAGQNITVQPLTNQQVNVVGIGEIMQQPTITPDPAMVAVVENPVVVEAMPTETPPAVIEQPLDIVQPTPTFASEIIIQPDPALLTPPPAVNSNFGVNWNAQPIIYTPYTVQVGDTLYRLSQNYATSIELMAQNGIDSEDLIAGNLLNLPIANPDYCIGYRPYVVRERETAYSIAVRFATTAADLQLINQLDANFSLKVSQVVCVP